MISAISNNNDYYYEKKLAAASSATTASKNLTGTAVAGLTSTASTQKKADTLELSATYVAQAAAQTDVTEEAVKAAPPPPPPAAKETTDETDAISAALADVISNVKDDSTDSSIDSLTDDTTTAAVASSTVNLTSKSERDLKSLVDDGTITQKEMDTEMARRSSENADKSVGSQKKAVALTSSQVQGIKAYLQQASYSTTPIENGNVLSIA